MKAIVSPVSSAVRSSDVSVLPFGRKLSNGLVTPSTFVPSSPAKSAAGSMSVTVTVISVPGSFFVPSAPVYRARRSIGVL